MSKAGRFITFEGVEGSGKTTIISMLAGRMRDLGEIPVLTREPGGSGLGRDLRPLLLDSSQTGLCAMAELYLFLADRAQHMEEEIMPSLAVDKTVICDRFLDSTIAYQSYGRGIELSRVRELAATHDREPDLTVLLDVPISLALSRARMRNAANGTEISEGRFEKEKIDFHERVRHGYLEQARLFPARIKVIDAAMAPDQVLDACLQAIENRFGSIAGWRF